MPFFKKILDVKFGKITTRQPIKFPDGYLEENIDENFSARDVILSEAYPSIRQALSEVAINHGIHTKPNTSTLQIANRLLKEGILDHEIMNIINTLINLAQEMEENPELSPVDSDALSYFELSKVVVDFLTTKLKTEK